MTSKKELILVTSARMEKNKKPNRNENNLIRLSAVTRNSLGFGDSVEVSGKHLKSLDTFQAFSKDIKDLREQGSFTDSEMKRIGFVTPETFRSLTSKNSLLEKNNIWISKTIQTTLIGADPEFLLFDNKGDVVHANNHLSKPGLVGSDGAMIEVRPEPSTTPEGLVQNIKYIFSNQELMRDVQDFQWLAAVYYKNDQRDYPVGGHIHLGNPVSIKKLSGPQKHFMFGVFNKILDELLSLPMIKLDGQDLGECRRSKCKMAMGNRGFGYYGEWRPCDGRLEHRTLSGLWLMHPSVAEAVLGTAKAIADEMFSLVDDKGYDLNYIKSPGIEFNDHKYLYRAEFDDWDKIGIAKDLRCVQSSAYMRSMLNTSKASSITKPFLTKWYNNIKKLSTYNKYAKHIDMLYAILSMPKKKISSIGLDLKKNWVEENELLL